MSKGKGKRKMQPASDIIAVKVPDPDPDAPFRRKQAMMIGRGVIAFREPVVPAAMNLRDDPLGHMYHRGREEIRLGRAQYEAGRKWQRTYEMAGIGRVRSPSDVREPVDGGGIAHSGATDKQMQAHKALHGWALSLGREGAELVEAVLADKRTLRQMALKLHNEASAANIKYTGRRFRECLSTLAKEMGLG